MGKSKKAKAEVTQYFMSAHYGICLAADALLAILVGEKVAWSGTVEDETAIGIDRQDLFGGIKKEGGVRGTAYFLPGGPLQSLPNGLTSRYGKTGYTSPGYRGLASIFFAGRVAGDAGWIAGSNGLPAGFEWGANNPYLRSIWARVRRAPKGLNPSIALIGGDANPVHIIFECLTDRDWGMGMSTGLIDIVSFEVAAQTIFTEAFGLSMIWTRQTEIENFVGEVIDHIQATLFVNPRTGLLTFKLLREDYDLASLRTITPQSAKLSNFQRKTWGETTNEIVVTFTNPETEEDETVAVQDLANIAMQGGEVVSSSRNYYGVRKRELAARLAERDLRAASSPLASCDADLLRKHWDILPGEVVKLTWPEYGIDQLVVRAGTVSYGKSGQNAIKVSFYEDVFSLAAARYLDPPDTEWSEPGADPDPADEVLVQTAPAFITAPLLDLASPSDLPEPEAVTMILAADQGTDTIGFDLLGEVVQANGSPAMQSLGERQFSGFARLALAIPAESETLVASFTNGLGATPLEADFIVLGDGSETATEIAIVDRIGADGWHLKRGLLDTVPRSWPAGTAVHNLPPDRNVYDITLRAEGEEVEYQILTRTSRGLLDPSAAPVERLTVSGRPHLPLRPASVAVNGFPVGPVAHDGADFRVTWANRNRLTETSQIVPWNAASVQGESGQTTLVEALSSDGTLLTTLDGANGSAMDVPASAFKGASAGRIRVISSRDGLRSLQAYEIVVTGMEPARLALSGTESGSLLLLSGDAQGGGDRVLLGAY